MVLFYLIGMVRFTEAFGAWPVAFFLLKGGEPDALRRNEIDGCRFVHTAVSTKIAEKGGKTKT